MKNINKTIFLMAIAAVTLTGCKSLYGKYERPEINTSGVFRDVVSDKDTLGAVCLPIHSCRGLLSRDWPTTQTFSMLH